MKSFPFEFFRSRFRRKSLKKFGDVKDGAKTLMPPLIGLGSAYVKLGAMTCTGPRRAPLVKLYLITLNLLLARKIKKG